MTAPLAACLREVAKSYSWDGQRVPALRGVSLDIPAGQFLAVAGPSGSGKSTLLNIVGCVEKPDGGKVLIEGEDVTGRSLDALAGLRAARLGYIFQTFNLLPVLTAAENVAYPLTLRGRPMSAALAQAEEMLDSVGLRGLGGRRPRELSGGQRQRVAVARALAGKPAVVVADEPTANLDRATGREVLELLKTLNRGLGATILLSTHDTELLAHADRVVELRDGRVTADRLCS